MTKQEEKIDVVQTIENYLTQIARLKTDLSEYMHLKGYKNIEKHEGDETASVEKLAKEYLRELCRQIGFEASRKGSMVAGRWVE